MLSGGIALKKLLQIRGTGELFTVQCTVGESLEVGGQMVLSILRTLQLLSNY